MYVCMSIVTTHVSITYHPEDHLMYQVCVHVCVCVCGVAWSSNLGPVVCVK